MNLMRLFSRKPVFCTICKKEISHKNKPKKEWNVKGPLCGDCYIDKANEYYEGKIRQACVNCGIVKKITDLWEPRWQWDMDGLLCKDCFDKKEQKHNMQKNFCSLCGSKLGFVRYNPKPKWKIDGQLCRKCWDFQKAKFG